MDQEPADTTSDNAPSISTKQIRREFGLTVSQWQRLRTRPDCPEPNYHGRRLTFDPTVIVPWVRNHLRLRKAKTLRALAPLCHMSKSTLQGYAKLPGFPKPVGEWRGLPAYDPDEVFAWFRNRRGGRDLPSDFTRRKRRRKPTTKG